MDALILIFFAALMFAAAASDIATMTIPNKISIALALAFPLAAFAAGYSFEAFAWQCVFGLAAFVFVFVLFHLNVMGGGDAKLIAAACLWLGLEGATAFIVWMAIAGGGLALIAIAARKAFQPSPTGPAFLNRLLSKDRGIPYGVAIAAGALAALPAAKITEILT
jgi:prepilin peptidase CpaA